MQNINDEIRARTEAFAGDIAALVRRMALEAVSSVLGAGGAHAAHVGHVGHAATGKLAESVAAPAKRGRPRKVVAAAPVAKAGPVSRRGAEAKPAPSPSKGPASKKPAAVKRPSGEKRPPAELAKLTEKLGEYIKSHPGLRMEAIGKALGTPTRELNLPIKKLLAGKKIRSEGHKRATEYFPA